MNESASRAAAPHGIRVGIMGTPVSSGNRGVLALGAALARLCLDAAPDVQVTLFGSHSEANPIPMRPHGRQIDVPIVHWRLSPKCALRDHLFVIVVMSLIYRCLPWAWARRRIAASIPWIRALEDTALVGDVRGGDSFSDIYGLQRFVIATLPVLSVIAVKGDMVQFPQTYGPFKSSLSRAIARWVLIRSSVIIARDRESQRVAQELVGTRQTVLLSPDVAFALNAECPPNVQVAPPLDAELPAPLVGLNINGLMFNGGYTGRNMFGLKLDYRKFLPQLVTELLAVHSGELLLVPHTFAFAGDRESDNDACRQLREWLPPALQSRVRVVTAEYNAHELKGIIGQCEFFIGSRMHACIAALSQGIPCVGVAYSMKFFGVFDSVGMGDWVVDGRSKTADEAIVEILGLYRRRADVTQSLRLHVEAARAKLAAVFRRILLGTPQLEHPQPHPDAPIGASIS